MNYEERRIAFNDEVVAPKCEASLLVMEDGFQLEKERLIQQFLTSFKLFCEQITEKQEKREKGAIGHITYSLLRTEIAEGQGGYLVEATDHNWYLDRKPITTTYDANWAFQLLHKLEKELVGDARMYVGANALPEVEKVKRDHAHKFHAYVVKLIRHVMPLAIQLEAYQALLKDEVFEVRVGEYLDQSEVVYKEDRRVKDTNKIKAWLEEKQEAVYTYEVFSHLQLCDGDYEGINVSYSNFEKCNLANSRWNGSMLLGTKLTNCLLEKAQFCNTFLCEADFSGSDLRNALFCCSIAANGLHDSSVWERPGFSPLRFTDADLRGADFAYSDMRGAVFLGANIDNVEFKGANLTGAHFSKVDFWKLTLDDEQRASIHWREEERCKR